VYGDWLPRQLFGKLTAFFAILRMIYLAFVVVLIYARSTDVIILDGVSAPVPILKLFGLKVLFYCHFPDLVSSFDAIHAAFCHWHLTMCYTGCVVALL
jgi:alpha-1,3/alpha-1,6-mannosyltransferase